MKKLTVFNICILIAMTITLLSGGIVPVAAQDTTPPPPENPDIIYHEGKITQADREAAAARAEGLRENAAAEGISGETNAVQPGAQARSMAAMDMGMGSQVPHYYGPYPNYANSPLRLPDAMIEFMDGGGTGAMASASVDPASGTITEIVLEAGGTGYTSAPMVMVSSMGTTGAGAEATATISGAVSAINLDNPGSGYTGPVIVNLLGGGGTGGTAEAVVDVSGVITGITVTNGGTGYTSAPTVEIIDESGTGIDATATAVISGSVTGVTLISGGTGYVTPGIRKFVDYLPGLGEGGANNLGQYIPVAQADIDTYAGSDYYEIAVVEYEEQMHSDLPPTRLRGYVQLSTSKIPGKQVQLRYPDGSPIMLPNGEPALAVDDPHYLGPLISATKDRPVRILFRNLLPTGQGGNLFIPVDTTVMGSGMGPDMGGMMEMDPQNPMCGMNPKPAGCYAENRATLHLHGGITPWISDGTPHQWITPAGDNTSYPEGVSVQNVPDMPDPGPGAMTFFYTNQQSARLMFYHDHSWGITRLNVYAGEAAAYLITDPTEQRLINDGIIPADQIPMVVQDKTFVPPHHQLMAQDPTWDMNVWGTMGDLWVPHVYVPAQNPGDSSGVNQFGRWAYGPWFWPPTTNIDYPPVANPYYDPNCDPDVQWCEPPLIPGVPNVSMGMEAFNDTPLVNGTLYPTLNVEPKSYRMRVLNAANDRFFNLSLYQAIDANGVVCDAANSNPAPEASGSTCTEVMLNPDEVAAALDDTTIFPTPIQSTAGPDWIQIGTEGGFLPAPVVIPAHPTTWVNDPTVFNAGNVDQHSLLLGPAERADVIVDFSQFAGQTLIVYNDAPAAFPARDPRYDYYTGSADLTDTGGAPSIIAGYGPNTRTVMQIRVANSTPASEFNLAALQNAFAHQADGSGVFESSQNPIIVGQGAYNSAYGTAFKTNGPEAGLAQIFSTELTFRTLLGNLLTIPLKPKQIQDEMGEAFEKEYGRMSGFLGLEAPGANANIQNMILYPYVNPASEILDGIELPAGSLDVTPIASADDGTQLWKITHNGVDTHPIHFHLYDVQLINRVGWDGIIRRPDPNELGWKDTVRISPLEDTIVALRPILPKMPFGLVDSIRPLNPMMPLGSTAMFNSTDANGNPITPPITNEIVNFGWEYVWHCHILSHEEMDMMRPVSVIAARELPQAPVVTLIRTNDVVDLQWTDGTPVTDALTLGNPANEIGYRIERAVIANGVPGEYVEIGTALANATAFTDTGLDLTISYSYRVIAYNAAGESVSEPVTAQGLISPPAAPTNLAAALQTGPQVSLTWTDNADNETGFVLERRVNNGAFTQIAAPGIVTNTGTGSFVDSSVTAGNTYAYRIKAVNQAGESAYSNTASVTIPVAPAAPSNLTLTTLTGPQVRLTWRDNATNETGFIIERSINSGAFTQIATPGPRTFTGNVTYTDTTVTAGNTYAYRVASVRNGTVSSYSNTATVNLPLPAAPAAPTNLTAAILTGPQVRLTWRDNATNETGFVVERSDNGGVFVQIATPGSRFSTGNVTYTDTTVVAGNTYAYRVKTMNGISGSAYSNTANVTLAAPPAVPSGLAVTATRNGFLDRVTLTWIDNSNTETGFVIQRATNATFTAGLTTINIGANVTTYSQSVARNRTYYYRIAATNAGVNSGWSNVVSILTP